MAALFFLVSAFGVDLFWNSKAVECKMARNCPFFSVVFAAAVAHVLSSFSHWSWRTNKSWQRHKYYKRHHL
jgi:hypothetical protein